MDAQPPEQRQILEVAPPDGDEDALVESQLIAQGRLSKHHRKETVRRQIHLATLLVFWVFVGVMLLLGAVWLYHLITPLARHFLSEEQLGTLQAVLLTAIGSSSITSHSKRWLQAYDDKE